ncbi:redoxin domain-containing protein [Rhizosphaericola mali]|uniref:DUF5106 domain-containing protein n=1 Tax=Rhizosphaericola mali TaxID=2545455 RepID=A0A5P2FXL8_9BACT|nr:redoxin domain-containing protein [Rhizosphaericola mali]QES87687.1 DUF5106 domain-containing protein [Rhizosphaericola mali]
MKKRIFFKYILGAFSLFMGKDLLAQKTGNTQISLTIKPYKNTWVYIGNYFGKFTNLTDSVYLNEQSTGVLKKSEKYPEGIYFAISPKKALLFEFLMDGTQHFQIVADTTNLKNVTITGSKENEYYSTYTKYIAQHSQNIHQLELSLSSAKTNADSTKIRQEISQKMNAFNQYRLDFVKQHPNSLLATYFQAMQRPIAPKIVGKDSTAPFYYVQEHYWDNVDLSDDRLLRTPFFEPKMDEYFKYYVSPEPDSVIKSVNHILLYSREGKEIHQYLLGKFTDKYINPEIMGQDKVFLYLFDNYYSKGDTTWLNDKQKKFIFERAYSLMANQIGEPAPSLDLKDSTGTVQPLNTVNGKYTLVIFWDPDCSHCKVIVPKIDSIYNAKWKSLGMKVYAVNTAEDNVKGWNQYVENHHLGDWINVTQSTAEREADAASNRANYRQLYDVYQTPTIYLLDKDKRIIAKKLTVDQIDGLLTTKEKVKK